MAAKHEQRTAGGQGTSHSILIPIIYQDSPDQSPGAKYTKFDTHFLTRVRRHDYTFETCALLALGIGRAVLVPLRSNVFVRT